MTRRRIFLLASGLGSAMAMAAACGFPDPQIVADGAEAGGDGSAQDGADDHASLDGGGGADVVPDVVEPDSPPPLDATSERPPVEAGCDACDCDNDGFRTNDAASGCTNLGNDCDDLDYRVYPDAGFSDQLPTAQNKGDWNCDGHVTREVPAVKVDCSNYSVLTGCASVAGFVGDPGCGELNTYVQCAVNTLGCIPGSSEDRKMRCK